MNTRAFLASVAAGAACAFAAHAESNHEMERFRHKYADLIQIVGENNADVSAKIRLSELYREAGAIEEANRLLAEAAEEYPDLNSLLNPSAMPDYQEMLNQERIRRASGGTTDAGADVIVGDLNGSGPGNYTSGGPVSGKLAFSIGTTSCNLGTVPLEWIELSNRHPVIAQNFFRLHNGRFEHIGMSWLKHGFCALQQGICGACQPFGNCCCNHLGLLCSDPYEASLNGSQSRLGPRNEVNASTGVYPWPHYLRGSTGNTIFKRLQVNPADMNTTTYANAIWIGEGQYVAFDDASAGNRNNNASYRRFNHTWNGTTVTAISWSGSTQRQKPAIQAWQDFDPTVQLSFVDVPNDGRIIVGSKVTDNGNGTWTYEYAVQNLNSDRSVQAFAIPAAGTVITSSGFHDVDYHDGDGVPNGTTQDGTDWAATVDGTGVSWATQTFADGPNANALRWSTLYNFRFTANRGPAAAQATLTLFKPGTPNTMTAAVQGPACLLAGDVNGDNMVDFADLNLVLSSFGTIYNFQDLNNVLAQFGQSC